MFFLSHTQECAVHSVRKIICHVLSSRARQNRKLRRHTHTEVMVRNIASFRDSSSSQQLCGTKFSFNIYFGVILDASVWRGSRFCVNVCLPLHRMPTLDFSPHAVTAKGVASQQTRACSCLLMCLKCFFASSLMWWCVNASLGLFMRQTLRKSTFSRACLLLQRELFHFQVLHFPSRACQDVFDRRKVTVHHLRAPCRVEEYTEFRNPFSTQHSVRPQHSTEREFVSSEATRAINVENLLHWWISR